MTNTSIEQWTDKVKKELGSQSWASAFGKVTPEGIALKPLYLKEDRPESSEPILSRDSREWLRIFELEDHHGNQDVLYALSLGASCLFIRFDSKDWSGLFEGVHLNMLQVYINTPIDSTSMDRIRLAYGEAWDTHPPIFLCDPITESCGMEGGLAYEPMPSKVRLLSSSLMVHQMGGESIHELSAHLRLWALAAVPLHDDKGALKNLAEQSILEVPVGSNIFYAVAKIRALKKLWLAFWGCHNIRSQPTVFAKTSPRMMSDCAVSLNILRATHSASAAIFASVDGLNVLPHDYRLVQKDSGADRLSLNIHSILSEEAILGAIEDPMSGSYYIESLTEELAERAWDAFRAWSVSNPSELLDKDFFIGIQSAWKQRANHLATRRQAITGVSEFPLAGETLAARTLHQTPLKYDSDMFTDIRRRVLAKGRRLIVHLFCIGKESSWTARSNFAENAFAVGGIEVVRIAVSEPNQEHFISALTGADQIQVICLCGSDGTYVQLKEEWARITGEANFPGDASLYLAGSPRMAEPFNATAIHLGCDLQERLTHLASGGTNS